MYTCVAQGIIHLDCYQLQTVSCPLFFISFLELTRKCSPLRRCMFTIIILRMKCLLQLYLSLAFRNQQLILFSMIKIGMFENFYVKVFLTLYHNLAPNINTLFCFFYQLEANYFTILQWVLSYIDRNQPWIHMYSPSRSPLPPPSLPDPSVSSQCTRPQHLSHASNLGW